jgi:hypothetical protein
MSTTSTTMYIIWGSQPETPLALQLATALLGSGLNLGSSSGVCLVRCGAARRHMQRSCRRRGLRAGGQLVSATDPGLHEGRLPR